MIRQAHLARLFPPTRIGPEPPIATGVAPTLPCQTAFVYLINLITNLTFFGSFSIAPSSLADNTYGVFVIAIPIIGGIIVGLMALYGSKAIRGHGIPEAMEQILTNQSRIKPSITYLKPLSAAISIGTGGPFGAEGPIIATGGALGSTVGQLIKITPNERKILLAAGATTAGMAAIFGSPIAGIFLAIELLLFEFSPRSFIPVALACITGAAGHHLLFGEESVFAMNSVVLPPSNYALLFYSAMGIAMGLLWVIATKIVYWIEDLFEELPIHWAWWPAIGGIAVGVIGFFAPRTLGVGYENITDLLSGSMPQLIKEKDKDLISSGPTGYDSYQWSPPMYLSCTDCQSPMTSTNDTITNTVEVEDALGCKNRTKIKILIDDYCQYDDVTIPNAFSPNDDGTNDFYSLSGTEFCRMDFRVFNRWGNIVYEAFNWDNHWNGRSQNDGILPQGTYFIQITFDNGIVKTGMLDLRKK